VNRATFERKSRPRASPEGTAVRASATSSLPLRGEIGGLPALPLRRGNAIPGGRLPDRNPRAPVRGVAGAPKRTAGNGGAPAQTHAARRAATGPATPSGGTARPASGPGGRPANHRPRIGRDHPANLSISLAGGKEINGDVLSSGERSGQSPSRISSASSRVVGLRRLGREARGGTSRLEGRRRSGGSPRSLPARLRRSGAPTSRSARECRPNRVRDLIQG
jgi:hypothetical protein